MGRPVERRIGRLARRARDRVADELQRLRHRERRERGCGYAALVGAGLVEAPVAVLEARPREQRIGNPLRQRRVTTPRIGRLVERVQEGEHEAAFLEPRIGARGTSNSTSATKGRRAAARSDPGRDNRRQSRWRHADTGAEAAAPIPERRDGESRRDCAAHAKIAARWTSGRRSAAEDPKIYGRRAAQAASSTRSTPCIRLAEPGPRRGTARRDRACRLRGRATSRRGRGRRCRDGQLTRRKGPDTRRIARWGGRA